MRRKRLLKSHTLVVKRKLKDGGYLDDNGDWISGELNTFSIDCNLQPYKEKYKQHILPEGVKTSDCRIIRTTEILYTTDQTNKQEADTVVINGLDYEVFSLDDFTGYGLNTDHYIYVIHRKDLI